MKKITELPDEQTLDKLIELAESAEQKAIALYESSTKIDEKWRIKLDNRRKLSLKQFKPSNVSENK
jgi:rubrerythrin